MNASDFTFDTPDEDLSLGMGLPEELLDSDAEIALGNLDLGDLDLEYVAPVESTPVTLSTKQKCDAIVRKLSTKPDLLTHLNKGVTEAKLTMLSHSVGFDVKADYESDDTFNMFINALAQGYISGDNFRDVVPNGIKIHFVPEDKMDSIHLHKSGDCLLYKSTPAITEFNQEAINTLSSVFRGRLESFGSLYKALQDACYKPLASAAPSDATSILAWDNLTLAKKIAGSRDPARSVEIIQRAGCSTARLNKIKILAKSIKDNK